MIQLKVIFNFILSFCSLKARPVKPRVVISTDIGGTNPDDNRSMIHCLMYANSETEDLIFSPSYS